MEAEYTTKAATFEISLHLNSKNTIIFFVTVLFNIFMRQKLTDDFWGVHKNMNCAFPTKSLSLKPKDYQFSKPDLSLKMSYLNIHRSHGWES